MNDFSEKNIRENCPHCDSASGALTALLEESPHFRIVCDQHPLVSGHILIIPKQHFSCVGEYPTHVFKEFLPLYKKVANFIENNYGSVSTFEHGKIGQTVFHSHVHLLPFAGRPEEIVPEGGEYLKLLPDLGKLKDIFLIDGMYLFFSILNTTWLVDTHIGAPRFFRDRFAAALHRPERGNWKEMHDNTELMSQAAIENKNCAKLWEGTMIQSS